MSVYDTDTVVEVLNALWEIDAGITLGTVLSAGGGDVLYRMQTLNEPFRFGIVDPNAGIRGVLQNQFSRLAIEGWHKERPQLFKTFPYDNMGDFDKHHATRRKANSLLSAVYLAPHLYTEENIETVLRRNAGVADSIRDRHNKRSRPDDSCTVFSLAHLTEALEVARRRTSNIILPLQLNIVADREYGIIGQVAEPFFGAIQEGGVNLFDPRFVTKQELLAVLARGELNNFEPAKSDVIIYNLACSEGKLSDPANLPLLEHLLKLNPASYIIVQADSRNYENLVLDGGAHHAKWEALQGLSAGPHFLHAHSIDVGEGGLSRTEAAQHEKYFQLMWADHEDRLVQFWRSRGKKFLGHSLPRKVVPGNPVSASDIKELSEMLPQRVNSDVNLARYSSIGIGGEAAVVVRPATLEEFAQAINYCHASELHKVIAGFGSNVIYGNIPGALILTHNIRKIMGGELRGQSFNVKGMHDALSTMNDGESVFLDMEGGASLVQLAKLGATYGLTDLVGFIGVPGTVGGAVVMNAGVGTVEFKHLVHSVQVINPDGLKTLPRNDITFRYRYSSLQETDAPYVGAIRLELKKGDVEGAKATMERCIAYRKNEPHVAERLLLPTGDKTKLLTTGSFWMSRSYELPSSAPGDSVQRGARDVIPSHAGGMSSTSGNIWGAKNDHYAAWLVAREGATLYDVLELAHKQYRAVAEGTGVKLALEVRFEGTTRSGEPLSTVAWGIINGSLDLQRYRNDLMVEPELRK